MSTKHHKYRTRRARGALHERARRGFRGYPIATIAYYGPDNNFASKVAVGIILQENGEVAFLERWFSRDRDVRADPTINQEIIAFLNQHPVKSVAMTDRIIGCPHEEGIDYPVGESCPECPYWANRDRWTGELIDEKSKAVSEVGTVIGVAWYRAEQWDRLREISVDRDKLEETYEEWLASAEEALRQIRRSGKYAEKVAVDVGELLAWCRARNLDVDGKARAQYVAEMLRQRDQKQGRQSAD
jgi:hypothetical protein